MTTTIDRMKGRYAEMTAEFVAGEILRHIRGNQSIRRLGRS
jgi:hypothetical protein